MNRYVTILYSKNKYFTVLFKKLIFDIIHYQIIKISIYKVINKIQKILWVALLIKF